MAGQQLCLIIFMNSRFYSKSPLIILPIFHLAINIYTTAFMHCSSVMIITKAVQHVVHSVTNQTGSKVNQFMILSELEPNRFT